MGNECISMEWQLIEDTWCFGHKIRGIVRDICGSVAFSEDLDRLDVIGGKVKVDINGNRYGWVWTVYGNTETLREIGYKVRGVADSLKAAIKKVETELGIPDSG